MLKKLILTSVFSISLFSSELITQLIHNGKSVEAQYIYIKNKYKEEFVKNKIFDIEYCKLVYNEDLFPQEPNLLKQIYELNSSICNYSYYNDKMNLIKQLISQEDYQLLIKTIDDNKNDFKLYIKNNINDTNVNHLFKAKE